MTFQQESAAAGSSAPGCAVKNDRLSLFHISLHQIIKINRVRVEKSSGQPISRILSDRGRPVYAPKSVFPALCLDGHLSGQPTRNSNDASSVSSLLGLAPGGGYLAACIAAGAGGLLHLLFTITALRRLSVSVARSGKFPRPGISPAPCSAECGLSSTPHRNAEPRPSSRPEAFLSYLFLEQASITWWKTIGYNKGTVLLPENDKGEYHVKISRKPEDRLCR